MGPLHYSLRANPTVLIVGGMIREVISAMDAMIILSHTQINPWIATFHQLER